MNERQQVVEIAGVRIKRVKEQDPTQFDPESDEDYEVGFSVSTGQWGRIGEPLVHKPSTRAVISGQSKGPDVAIDLTRLDNELMRQKLAEGVEPADAMIQSMRSEPVRKAKARGVATPRRPPTDIERQLMAIAGSSAESERAAVADALERGQIDQEDAAELWAAVDAAFSPENQSAPVTTTTSVPPVTTKAVSGSCPTAQPLSPAVDKSAVLAELARATGLGDLISFEPTPPKVQVIFSIPGDVVEGDVGHMRVRYHRVVWTGSALVLVYDTRWEHGDQFLPPPTLRPSPVVVPSLGLQFNWLVVSSECRFNLGAYDFAMLLVHPDHPPVPLQAQP